MFENVKQKFLQDATYTSMVLCVCTTSSNNYGSIIDEVCQQAINDNPGMTDVEELARQAYLIAKSLLGN